MRDFGIVSSPKFSGFRKAVWVTSGVGGVAGIGVGGTAVLEADDEGTKPIFAKWGLFGVAGLGVHPSDCSSRDFRIGVESETESVVGDERTLFAGAGAGWDVAGLGLLASRLAILR